jgi:alpha-beta hydrolase superfamily lysophospholipase
MEEALDVAVDEADDGYSDGWRRLGGCVVGVEGGGENSEDEEEFGEAHSSGTSVTLLRWRGMGRSGRAFARYPP